VVVAALHRDCMLDWQRCRRLPDQRVNLLDVVEGELLNLLISALIISSAYWFSSSQVTKQFAWTRTAVVDDSDTGGRFRTSPAGPHRLLGDAWLSAAGLYEI
jgi:hypothetical protein